MRIPLKGGDEFDALTKWRTVLKLRAGVRKAAKRSYARRLRQWLKAKIGGSAE